MYVLLYVLFHLSIVVVWRKLNILLSFYFWKHSKWKFWTKMKRNCVHPVWGLSRTKAHWTLLLRLHRKPTKLFLSLSLSEPTKKWNRKNKLKNHSTLAAQLSFVLSLVVCAAGFRAIRNTRLHSKTRNSTQSAAYFPLANNENIAIYTLRSGCVTY